MVLTRQILLIVTLALIVLAQQSRMPVAAEARQASRGFLVGGLALGMDLAEFKMAFPAAQITIHEAARYCYGRRLVLDQLSWASADSQRGDVSVRVTLHQINNRFHLTSLVRTETIDPHEADLRDLRDRMMRQHGPYTRLLARRKMEPAGRIVGFEWSRSDEQNLSVVVHEDHAENIGRIIVTTRLTSALPGMRTARTMAAHNRVVIETFRQQCRMANN